MKKTIAIVLVLAALLVGCGKTQAPETTAAAETQDSLAAPTAEATVEATEAPTTVPTTVPATEPAPVYTNPLTGEILDAPTETRVFAVTINNLQDAMPHYGTMNADIFLEMFVNHSIIRGLALYNDPSDVPAIGAVRSTRYMFTDIAEHYNAIVAHAGGSSMVLNDIKERGVDGFNIDTWDDSPYSFRDKDRNAHGYSWDACLFAKGEGLIPKAQEEGIDVARDPDQDFGFVFTDNGTPEGGERADKIDLTFTFTGFHGTSRKDSSMIYNADLGKYVYHQYGKDMVDGATDEPEAFQNVLILMTPVEMNPKGYHIADFVAGGEGYYACGGKLIPIQWKADGDYEPLKFYTQDGQPLQMGVGNSYIAIAPLDSVVSWEALAVAETEAGSGEVAADAVEEPAE